MSVEFLLLKLFQFKPGSPLVTPSKLQLQDLQTQLNDLHTKFKTWVTKFKKQIEKGIVVSQVRQQRGDRLEPSAESEAFSGAAFVGVSHRFLFLFINLIQISQTTYTNSCPGSCCGLGVGGRHLWGPGGENGFAARCEGGVELDPPAAKWSGWFPRCWGAGHPHPRPPKLRPHQSWHQLASLIAVFDCNAWFMSCPLKWNIWLLTITVNIMI